MPGSLSMFFGDFPTKAISSCPFGWDLKTVLGFGSLGHPFGSVGSWGILGILGWAPLPPIWLKGENPGSRER